MKALILNSGVGRRMGVLTSEHPKCMTDISKRDTILSRQLKLLSECGVTEVIMTTGLFNDVLVDYCNSLNLPMTYTFVYNRDYAVTNYIQSIYCAMRTSCCCTAIWCLSAKRSSARSKAKTAA